MVGAQALGTEVSALGVDPSKPDCIMDLGLVGPVMVGVGLNVGRVTDWVRAGSRVLSSLL
jgi:hypothetical protein